MKVVTGKKYFSKDIRECRSAWNFLSGYGVYSRPDTLDAYNVKILEKIEADIQLGNNDYETLRRKIVNHYEECMVNLNDIEWINKKNTRACYFVYKWLQHFYIYNNTYFYFPNQDKAQGRNLFFMLNIKPPAANSALSKYEIIIKVIDNLRDVKQKKLRLLNKARIQYEKNVLLTDFSWFKDKEVDPKWLYDYIHGKLFGSMVIYKQDSFSPLDPLVDPLASAIEIFDMWDGEQDSKELFVIKLKKTYNQILYRKRKKGKQRSYSYSMSLDIKDKMDELALFTGKNKNSIVQGLILEAYEKMQKERKG